MNQKEAKDEAKRRWGPAGNAEHISHEDPNWRFVVGRMLVNGKKTILLPLGSGRDFESAFIAADYQKERRMVALSDGKVYAEGDAADVLFESAEETRARQSAAPPAKSADALMPKPGPLG